MVLLHVRTLFSSASHVYIFTLTVLNVLLFAGEHVGEPEPTLPASERRAFWPAE